MMDKREKKWEKMAQQVVELKEVTPFELGVLAGLSSKYDFRSMDNQTNQPQQINKIEA